VTVGAIILGAGFGTRLAPLTDHTPKPLLKVGAKPVASHLVDRLRELPGLSTITVVVNDQHPTQWQDWAAAPSTGAVQLLSTGATTNAERNGAVADLAAAVSATGSCDWIVVVAGDNLLDESFEPHLDEAIARKTPVVLCRDLGDSVPGGRFGEITADDDGRIIGFREKPESPQSPLVATCTYLLPGTIGVELADYLVDGDPDSAGRFIGWLAQRRPVIARPLTGRYFDIGSHETLAAARAAY
jgi:glucose-1-phosphate thymidylyltransferase